MVEVGALIFPDELKLFLEVSSDSDLTQLQFIWDTVLLWCEASYVKVNPGRCSVGTYHQSLSPLIFLYLQCDDVA